MRTYAERRGKENHSSSDKQLGWSKNAPEDTPSLTAVKLHLRACTALLGRSSWVTGRWLQGLAIQWGQKKETQKPESMIKPMKNQGVIYLKRPTKFYNPRHITALRHVRQEHRLRGDRHSARRAEVQAPPRQRGWLCRTGNGHACWAATVTSCREKCMEPNNSAMSPVNAVTVWGQRVPYFSKQTSESLNYIFFLTCSDPERLCHHSLIKSATEGERAHPSSPGAEFGCWNPPVIDQFADQLSFQQQEKPKRIPSYKELAHQSFQFIISPLQMSHWIFKSVFATLQPRDALRLGLKSRTIMPASSALVQWMRGLPPPLFSKWSTDF